MEIPTTYQKNKNLHENKSKRDFLFVVALCSPIPLSIVLIPPTRYSRQTTHKTKMGPSKSAKGKSVASGKADKKTTGSQKRKGAKSNKGRGITKGSIRRLARRGGCKRLASSVYDEAREILRNFVEQVMKDTHALMEVRENAPAKTVRVEHILYALKKRGRTLYVSK